VELSTARRVPAHARTGRRYSKVSGRTIIFYRSRVSARFMYTEPLHVARVIEFDIKKQRPLEILTTRTAHARRKFFNSPRDVSSRGLTAISSPSRASRYRRAATIADRFLPRKLCVLRNFRGRRECISSFRAVLFPMRPAQHDEHEESGKPSASLYPLAKLGTLGITVLAPNSSIWISALRGCSSSSTGEFASNAGVGGEKNLLEIPGGIFSRQVSRELVSPAHAVPEDSRHPADERWGGGVGGGEGRGEEG